MSHQILKGKISVGVKAVRVLISDAKNDGIEPGIYRVELVFPLNSYAKVALTEALAYGDFEKKVSGRKDVLRMTFEAPIYKKLIGGRKKREVLAVFLPVPVVLTLARKTNIKNAVVYVRPLEKLSPPRPLAQPQG